jgi:hypothetical protein
MKAEEIFQRLWKQYSSENPSAGKIYNLFQESGEQVVNDHVAFRTFNDPRVNIEVLSRLFLDAGYVPKGDYVFEAKKLMARHYELPGYPEAPRVFISELLLEEFSDDLQNIIKTALDSVDADVLSSPELIFQGRLFDPVSYEVYEKLRQESEYAAWLYVYGYRANHFTVSINYLKNFEGIEAVNAYLKAQGFELNSSGGEIKGNPGQLLEQSSTLADRVEVDFSDGKHVIPSCYYEFARRYEDSQGRLFNGFVAGSADKIFESTNYR